MSGDGSARCQGTVLWHQVIWNRLCNIFDFLHALLIEKYYFCNRKECYYTGFYGNSDFKTGSALRLHLL